MPLTQFSELHPWVKISSRGPSDATDPVEIAPSPQMTWRIDNVLVVSTDTSARTVELTLGSDTTTVRLGSCVVPAGAGLAGAKPIDVLAGSLPTGVLGLVMMATNSLYLRTTEAITAGKEMSITVLAGIV